MRTAVSLLRGSQFGRYLQSTGGTSVHRTSAFFWRVLITDICPQFEQVVRYDLDVVKTGMKNSVNLVARSSR